jgi:hypothetical protein
MSADGTLVTEPHLINTLKLLTSEDFEDCLGSLSSSFVVFICLLTCFILVLFPPSDRLPFLCFAGKMKDLGALVNAASKKISAKRRRKNVPYLEHLIAGSGPGSTSGPVVDLEGDEPYEELV